MRIVIILAACVMLYFILRHLFQHNPTKFTRYFFFTLIGLFLVGLFLLAISGRLHWLLALLAGLAPWWRRILSLLKLAPLVKIFQGASRMKKMGAGRSAGQRSTVSSHFFEMTLNHDTGEIIGSVSRGEFEGQQLQALSEPQLQRLLSECKADRDSYALLCSYLNYRFGSDWQSRFHEEPEAGQQGGESAPSGMSREEALDILGLEDPVDQQSVIRAHRSLMQRFHPDRGGSNYLAAKINEAKDLLLNEAGN